MNLLYIALDAKNYALRICNEMAKQGHKITCMVLNKDFFDNEVKIDMEENITVFELQQKEFYKADIFLKKYFEHIKNANVDAIFGVSILATPIVDYLATLLKKPKYMMLLDVPIDLIEKEPARKRDWGYHVPLLKRMNDVIFSTKIARDEFNRVYGKYYPNDNIVTYPTFLPEKFFKSGIKNDEGYIVSACRLTPTKNCIIIPYAMSKLKTVNTYVAIGKDGGQLKQIRHACEKFGINFVHYDGITDERKFEIIKGASMMIYPQDSKYIGGLAPFEGMFVGIPVIVPNLKVLKDLYQGNCSYFDNGGIYSLATQIAMLSLLKKEYLIDRLEISAEFSKQEVSFEKAAKGILNVLEE